MKKIRWVALFTIVSLFAAITTLAQLSDDFSDGDFTQNPQWNGNEASFIITDGELQLQAPADTESAYLSTPSAAIKNAVWEMSVRLLFNPSGSNYTRLYLTSDSPDLSAALNGYYVLIGGASDEISLFRQSGTSSTKLIDGLDNVTDGEPVEVSIRVVRDAEGLWELFWSKDDAEYTSEGTVYDDVHSTSAYMGMFCRFTATRSSAFYFDDITVSGEANLDVPAQPQYKDVIVTEIFADPSPVVGLPAVEFVEVYNRSDKSLKLSGWTLSDGSSTGTLSSVTLQQGDYLILTATANVEAFSAFGKVVGVTSFPSLNNASDALVLKSITGLVVDTLYYESSWYNDSEKQKGGWSLELIDPQNVCGEKDNWTSSQDEAGGTPGRQNSVFANKPDMTGPVVTQAIAVSPNEILVEFNENLADEDFESGDFLIEPPISIEQVTFVTGALKTLRITTGDNLSTGVLYNLTIQRLRDCNFNFIQEPGNQTVFALPEEAEKDDVIINEILFNPLSGGVDFVELYNRSTKYINLKQWMVSNIEGDQVTNVKIVTEQDKLLHPGAYLVLTPDPDMLIAHYPSGHLQNFFSSSLPSLPDDEGSIALLRSDSLVIDAVSYHDDLHSPFIKNDDGVSLERVSFHSSSADPQNWKSASTTVGYATPGYINSNTLPQQSFNDDVVEVLPEIFEPVYGQPNFTRIHYKLDKGGYVANAKIYDGQGRLIKVLANNELLGTEGFYQWDGDRDDGSAARVGYYVVWFELVDADGGVRSFRKRVVIAARF